MAHGSTAGPCGRVTAGLGLKSRHHDEALACPAAGLWFEVHPENYMVAGGPRLAWLDAIRRDKPLSLHGVGLSLAADEPPDAEHLARLKALADRYEPFVMSEHLAGHAVDEAWGEALLIDTHGAPVSESVWALYARTIARIGRRPTLIERDDNTPDFVGLMAERDRADGVLRTLSAEALHREAAHA